MEYVNLGATGLRVSRICLGMMSYGNNSERPWVLDEDAAEPIVRAAADGGVNFYDTADVYSAGRQRDRHRAAARQAVQPRGSRGGDQGTRPDHARPRTAAACPASTSWPSIDASLARLDMDYVDLYQIHRWDPRHARSRRRWRRCTTWSRQARPATSAPAACSPGSSPRRSTPPSAHGWTRFVSMQNHYNLVYREEEREMIPQCIDQGVGVIPWSPLARGVLAGNRTRDGGKHTTRANTDAFGDALYTDGRGLRRRGPRGRDRRGRGGAARPGRPGLAAAPARGDRADRGRHQGRPRRRTRWPPSSWS